MAIFRRGLAIDELLESFARDQAAPAGADEEGAVRALEAQYGRKPQHFLPGANTPPPPRHRAPSSNHLLSWRFEDAQGRQYTPMTAGEAAHFVVRISPGRTARVLGQMRKHRDDADERQAVEWPMPGETLALRSTARDEAERTERVEVLELFARKQATAQVLLNRALDVQRSPAEEARRAALAEREALRRLRGFSATGNGEGDGAGVQAAWRALPSAQTAGDDDGDGNDGGNDGGNDDDAASSMAYASAFAPPKKTPSKRRQRKGGESKRRRAH